MGPMLRYATQMYESLRVYKTLLVIMKTESPDVNFNFRWLSIRNGKHDKYLTQIRK